MPTSPDADLREPTWQLLLEVSCLRRAAQLPSHPAGFALDAAGSLLFCAPEDLNTALLWHPEAGLAPGPALSAAQQDLASLYCPIAAGPTNKPVAIAHLGQSLDARIATASGDSYYVTGPENLLHLHRMRALCDAILVGSNTVQQDDPKLTTRLAAGPNPVRIILDPAARLPLDHQLFSDGSAPSFRIVADQAGLSIPDAVRNDPRTILVSGENRTINPARIRQVLADRGYRVLFLEGGGLTISSWLEHHELDRLQLACAPILVGDGIASVQHPPVTAMRDAMRAPCNIYQMGEDIMWDFALNRTNPANASTATDGVFRRLK
ncbi:MAG: RibD family protein [Burkholderiaceae bacterium]